MTMRRARITFEVIEEGDDISLHFDDDRFPPLWFNRHQRPAGHSKLHQTLDQLEIDEEMDDKGGLAS
jgi:SOS response regulatory protein OraA/RecX